MPCFRQACRLQRRACRQQRAAVLWAGRAEVCVLAGDRAGRSVHLSATFAAVGLRQCWVIGPDLIEQTYFCESNFRKYYPNNSC